MDIIERMQLARAKAGITNAQPESKSKQAPQSTHTKSLRDRRAEICENKPKAKIVLEYFKDLIQHNLEDSEDEEP